MIVGGFTTCHTQNTWDRNVCVFVFNRTTLQVFVTYLTGVLYVHPLWFYRVIRNYCRGLTTCHTHYTWDNSLCIFVFNRTTLQVFVTYLTGAQYVLLNNKIHIILSEVYCVWRVVKSPTINSNNTPTLNTDIYHHLPPTCFHVCYTIFKEIIAILAQKLYAFCNAGA